MKRPRFVSLIALVVLIAVIGVYFFNQYWIHRYDAQVARQANIYRLDPDLVWSVIYEETYFSPWKTGKDGEIGLMQVTPAVGREWASETGMHEFERQMASDPGGLLHDPERNIQIGCWYLEKMSRPFRDVPGAETRMLAAYNAGLSRATEWNRTATGAPALSGDEFIKRIEISSTRAYVSSIMERYRKLKQNRGTGNSNRQRSSPPFANEAVAALPGREKERGADLIASDVTTRYRTESGSDRMLVLQHHTGSVASSESQIRSLPLAVLYRVAIDPFRHAAAVGQNLYSPSTHPANTAATFSPGCYRSRFCD